MIFFQARWSNRKVSGEQEERAASSLGRCGTSVSFPAGCGRSGKDS